MMSETGRAVSLLRDIFSSDFEAIHINDKETYEEIRDYVALISPEKKDIVKYYNSEVPIFDNFNVTKQLKSSFSRTVSLKSGAYLIIEHTEALHVIDVNSGIKNRTGTNDQELNSMEVNLAAAAEIAHQLRLRDMGGIIVVDFIDLQDQANRQALFEAMINFMEPDRARHKVLPLSRFGLMQITRHRVRPIIHVKTEEVCPTCFGRGKTQSSILFIDTLQNQIDYVVNDLKIKNFTLYVHPYVYAFINQGLFSLKYKWKRKYSWKLKVLPIQSYGFLEYRFVDKDKNEIDLQAGCDY